MKFFIYQRTELTTFWLNTDVDCERWCSRVRVGQKYVWGDFWILSWIDYEVELQKEKRKFCLLDFIFNFKIAETSNVKRNFFKNQKKPKNVVIIFQNQKRGG